MANYSWHRIGAALLAISAAVSAYAGSATALSEDEQKLICEEAAARYRQLFGTAMADAPVPVIAMYKYTFCPPKLDVRQGSKVRFINLDRRTSHSFWFRDAGRAESERYFGGEGSEMVMDLPPGTHTYLCGPHFERESMIGQITVVP